MPCWLSQRSLQMISTPSRTSFHYPTSAQSAQLAARMPNTSSCARWSSTRRATQGSKAAPGPLEEKSDEETPMPQARCRGICPKEFEKTWDKQRWKQARLSVARYVSEIAELVQQSLDMAQWPLKHGATGREEGWRRPMPCLDQSGKNVLRAAMRVVCGKGNSSKSTSVDKFGNGLVQAVLLIPSSKNSSGTRREGIELGMGMVGFKSKGSWRCIEGAR